MKLSTHLTFNGQCEAAFKFYERALGGKIDLMLSYGDSPAADRAAAHWRDKIVHANLIVGDQSLAGADVVADKYDKPQGFYVLVSVSDPSEAQRIFDTLAEGGEIQMPFQKTFWSPGFGVLVDRFGTPWEINCESTEVDGD